MACVEKAIPLIDLAANCGWWLLYKDTIIASEKPCEIHILNKRLHRDGGAAILYRDGWGIYALNGVRVPKDVAEILGVNMPLERWANEANVEVRREIEKKIGTERILREMNTKAIHEHTICLTPQRSHTYRVLEMSLPSTGVRRVLEMVNPSTGETHREWIPPECKTVQDALRFRNGTQEIPVVLT